ncbi:proteasome subunit beta [Amycolatopsis sp.]|jgi:proteasome beta subunit|uniref:proteasome subunit beta n=1 Tax=Amycolatopsis sp. TaxID=37632 RepID=UPI002DFABD4B|nr:proteasome subunit beta [Amycolatopsis sp.]
MTMLYGNDERHQLAKYMSTPTSSFTELLAEHHPGALPWSHASGSQPGSAMPHGTTIITLRFADGIVMAGDRQVTSGTTIAYRYGEKVYAADNSSVVGVAGTAALAFEMAKLFQVELLHYEKIEGVELSLQGKANKLAGMVRGNLEMAMQGLTVVPLYAGYDADSGIGRIYSYDPAGGLTEEFKGYHSIGSGSIFALGSLKKLHDVGLDEQAAVTVALEALYDAAEGDTATMGPDLARGIYPIVHVVTADGGRALTDAETETFARGIVERRQSAPDGPRAIIES